MIGNVERDGGESPFFLFVGFYLLDFPPHRVV